MKKFFVALFVTTALLAPLASEAYVSVKGHYRNGKYIAPHVRSEPNGLKYDNYSYTPSQGLYNKTYGTRGAEWDMPTYITDPDYYTGKAIYDAGNASSYSFGDSTSYAQSADSSYTNFYYSGTTYPAGKSNSNNKSPGLISSIVICSSDEIKYLERCMNKATYCRAINGEAYFYDESLKSCASCPSGYKYDGNGQCKTQSLLDSQSSYEASKQAQDRLKRKGRI